MDTHGSASGACAARAPGSELATASGHARRARRGDFTHAPFNLPVSIVTTLRARAAAVPVIDRCTSAALERIAGRLNILGSACAAPSTPAIGA
jgi:hypothetical protein